MSDGFGVLRAPETVLFGEGMLAGLPDQVARLGSKVLICTDPVVASLPSVHSVIGHLQSASEQVVVFSETEPERSAGVSAWARPVGVLRRELGARSDIAGDRCAHDVRHRFRGDAGRSAR